MKSKSIKRITVAFLALFLVVISLSSILALPISAAKSSDKEEVKKYETTDKKPTYTETLNQNNELLSKIADKKENKLLSKIKNDGPDWITTGVGLADSIINGSGDEVDWAKVGVGIGKEIISAIAGIWGFDGVASALLDGIESLLSSGQAPLSEVQVLSDDISKQFNDMGDKINDVQEELGALSNQVTESVNNILSGTEAQINNLEAKQILRDFMSSGTGNFSYLEYSNYLYGSNSYYVSSAEAYYILLLDAIQCGNSELIELYYNKLYESISDNIHIYSQYYYGDVPGLDKSIAAYYYDYVSYNPDLLDENTTAEYEALMFALDLYTTYMYSYEMLEMCYAYQMVSIQLDPSITHYEYADGKFITISIIENELSTIEEKLLAAENQIAKDIAYILNIENSYIAVDESGEIHDIGNYGDSFGNIADNQIIYLNVIPDEICDLFLLNSSNIRYYVNGTEYRNENRGVVDSSKIPDDTFSVSVKYNSTEIYSIDFTKIDQINNNPSKPHIEEFSGGSGTSDDPYLISNAVQLSIVGNDLEACYKLISKIEVVDTHSPIGTSDKPFEGVFDGNGFAIDGLTVDSLQFDPDNINRTPTTGMFGTIHKDGKVKNLTLKNFSVTSDYDTDKVKPENDRNNYCIGGIAGLNYGTISNCTIKNASITVNRNKEMTEDRNVFVYVGGIVGRSSGAIEYCTVDSLQINASSYLFYGNQSIQNNQHSLYVAGIAAEATNVVTGCRVSESTSVSAYAKSTANSEDNEKPIVKVYVGGIIANDEYKSLISNVYSACKIVSCIGDIYNEGEYGGTHRYSWDNVSVKEGTYYPIFLPLSDSEETSEYEMHFFKDVYNKLYADLFAEKAVEVRKLYGRETLTNIEVAEVEAKANKETKKTIKQNKTVAEADANKFLINKITSSYDDPRFTITDKYLNVNIEIFDNVCDINSMFLTDYFKKSIDENGTKNAKFTDADGNIVNATIVGYYGFNTYHESENAKEISVKVFFYVDGELLCDDIIMSIKPNELVSCEIRDFYNGYFERGASSSDCENLIFENGFWIVYTYSNGQTEEILINNNELTSIKNIITSTPGFIEINIEYFDFLRGKKFTFKQTVEIKCHHETKDFVQIGVSEASCTLLGYEIWECQKNGDGCGKIIHKNYFEGNHKYIIGPEQNATCKEAGFTQRVYCPDCNTIFEESQWIQALPHNYVSSLKEEYKQNDAYPANEYHYCSNGDHYEAHQYTVSEFVDEKGVQYYVYSCFCGYENPVPDYNIKTKEEGKLPTVIVTDGYVLNVGDTVVVYVQILNNPGFNGAAFGIRYDDGLELISAEEGVIVPNQLKTRNEVYNGYNFLWGDENNETTEDGYLLKLTFKYVNTDIKNPEQNISVVYGMSNGSNGGFVTHNNEIHKFMTQSGTVTIVDHLPGDVNDSATVDIMDATYIAWSIVGKPDTPKINAKYADVNLDGVVDLLDVLAILQSISGRYGTSLLKSDYKLLFNLNGFICNDVNDSVTIEFYDENGNRKKWGENVDFEAYKEFMARLGYKFVGWYTRIACTCTDICTHLVSSTDYISYDKYQKNQTLYARWERNNVIFDMNGATSRPIDKEIYDSNNPKINLNDSSNIPAISYDVKYRVTGYDGTYAIIPVYKNFDGWYIEGTDTKITELDLSTPNLGTVTLVARWSDFIWNKPVESREGYYDVKAWYYEDLYDSNYSVSVIDDSIIELFNKNGFVLYGKSNPIAYTITYENDYGLAYNGNTTYNITQEVSLPILSGRDGYEFSGWLNEKGEIIKTIAVGSVGDKILTAKWSAISYKITLEGIDVNPTSKTDEKGNPKYESKTLGTIYFTYGDDEHEQGFYKESDCIRKVTIDYFNDLLVNNSNQTHFVFGGLYRSSIDFNGHSYASYVNESCVLSSDFNLEGALTSTELYVLFKPKAYTIKFDYNISSKKALVLTNSDATLNVGYYYNEICGDENGTRIKLTMPQSKYYVTTKYAYSGIAYFDENGNPYSNVSWDFGDGKTFKCEWKQKYENETYIYDASGLSKIGSTTEYKKYRIIVDKIDLSGYNWSPISAFYGELNGDSHTIENLTYNQTDVGKIGLIKDNYGTIKNIKINKFIFNKQDSNNGGTVYIGALCAYNNGGTLDNISVTNSQVYAHTGDDDKNVECFGYGGGICGWNNYGTISNCSVSNTPVHVASRCQYKTVDSYVGGIVGVTIGGSITNATSTNNTIYAYARASWEEGKNFWGNVKCKGHGCPYAYAGGVAGRSINTTITTNEINNNVSVEAQRTCPCSDNKGSNADNICGKYN